MRYLGLALYAEGPTDYRFLRPLLERACMDICAQAHSQTVEVSEVLALDHPATAQHESRERRIVASAESARGAWQILFIHADGNGDTARVRREQAEPAIQLLREQVREEGLGVAVVPVRETEAWAICDADVVAQVFGTTLTARELGLPDSAGSVESVPDPKAVLNQAFEATHPTGRRRKSGTGPFLNALGEQVRLERLRQLEAFRQFEADLTAALRELRLLP